MKNKILVIRSVSFQQLDKNIKEIVKQFPGHEIHLLTHSHGITGAKSYTSIANIIDYGSRKNFSMFHIPTELKNFKKESNDLYEAVVVPVTNLSGAGFLNVFLMSLRIPSRSIWGCNLVSKLWKIQAKTIALKAFKAIFSLIISAVLTIPFLILFLPVLFVFHLGSRFSRSV